MRDAVVGNPTEVMYKYTLQVLHAVATGRETAESVLVDIIRALILSRDEQQARIDTLLQSIRANTVGNCTFREVLDSSA